jgi:hypothetical protein
MLTHGVDAVSMSCATVGRLGPTKLPVVDVAVPESPKYVPGVPVTIAVKVVRPTAMTYTVCPFKNVANPVNPLSKKPSFVVGAIPVYVKVPRLELPRIINWEMIKIFAKV